MVHLKEFLGEFIGTFIMVFFGVGAVAVTVLFGAHSGTLQIGLIWGVAIALAIYATRNLSNAHFNTAVSVAMVLSKRMSAKKLPVYLTAQLLGAIIAAWVLFALLGGSIDAAVASVGGWSEPSGIASVFLETYPNTPLAEVSTTGAFAAEAIGVFLLVTMIFALTEGANLGRPDTNLAPLFIGLTVTIIICVVGPLTDAGLNPARDLGPRIVGALAGWGSFAFSWEIILVYVCGPLVGGALAALVLLFVIEPLMRATQTNSGGVAAKASRKAPVSDGAVLSSARSQRKG
jgi:glycerol uptake facilitator protein